MILNLQILQEELKRIGEWIRFSDQKAAFVAVYYSAIITFFISKKGIIIQHLEKLDIGKLFFFNSLIFLLLISISFGVYYFFSSVFPILKNNLNDESLFYFGTISKMKFSNFLKEMSSLTENHAKEQFIEQIHTTSLIADKKMNNIQKSIKCLFVSVFFILVIYFYFGL